MRRTSAILILIAMFAIPLNLLARGIACDQSRMNGASYCVWPGQSASHQPRPMCGQRAMPGHNMPCCQCMRSGDSGPNYGFLAPIAPTQISLAATPAAPAAVMLPVNVVSEVPVSGFFNAPFVPPRS